MTAQNTIHHNFSDRSSFEEKIEFNDNNTGYKIVLDVDKSLSHIDFKFEAIIDKGDLLIVIFDPNGKREGGFELQARTTPDRKHNSTSVNGNMKKQILHPLLGEWVISVKAINAKGTITVSLDTQR